MLGLGQWEPLCHVCFAPKADVRVRLPIDVITPPRRPGTEHHVASVGLSAATPEEVMFMAFALSTVRHTTCSNFRLNMMRRKT
jgi:hypothetical protein